MQRVGFDIVKVGVSRNGNDRLLTIVDYFTKWVELVPIPDEKATTIATALFNNWITRTGVGASTAGSFAVSALYST